MKTIFWNVDTQYDFMRSSGKLYVQGAEGIERNLNTLTRFADKYGIKVVNTADWHNKDSEELSKTPDFKTTFPEHCMQGTPGAGFVEATDPGYAYRINWSDETFDSERVLGDRNIILYKDKFDVFRGTPHADGVVRLLKPEKAELRAVVYGVATNVCVNDAVLGLLERGVQVYVPTDAIKELPNLPLPYEAWKNKGVRLTTTDKVCKMLEARL